MNFEKIIQHLQTKWDNRCCPMCKSNVWTMSDKPFELREFYDGNLVVTGSIIPVIPVSCNNCGNTILVNALMAGAIEGQKVKGGKNEQ